MKILKSIGLYFVYPFLTFILGILTHIGYLNYFYPHKYSDNMQFEAGILEENTYNSKVTDFSSENPNPDVTVSSDKINIQPTLPAEEKTSGYYLMVLDGKIAVMEEDKKTIYLTTDIYVDALSDSLKKELLLGKFIHTMDELYGFLESYTS